MLIEAYIQDHIGGNRSNKTVEWHRTALGLLRSFLRQTRINNKLLQSRTQFAFANDAAGKVLAPLFEHAAGFQKIG